MSAIVPPAAPPPPPSGGSGAVVALQILANAKALDGLATGVLLDAVAQTRAAKGMLEVMTAAGPVQLKALPGQALPTIPNGAKLVMQLVGQGGEAQLRLLSVNGRPLMGAAPLLAGQHALSPSPGAPMGVISVPRTVSHPQINIAAAPQVQPGIIAPVGLTAVLIRPATLPGQGQPGQTQVAGLPPDLPAGTQLTVRIAGIAPPQPGGTPSAQPAPPAPPPTTTPTVAAPATPSVVVPAAGNPVTQTAQMPAMSPSATSPSSPPAATLVINGTVMAHPPGGHAVLRTPIGTLALPAQGELVVGTSVRLEVAGPPLPPSSPAVPVSATRPEGLSVAGWPALADTIQTLATSDKQALELLMRAIPQAGPRLAASMSMFVMAQRSGDKGAIIGDSITRALDKAGRRDLAERLKADFDGLSDESARPLAGGEWRGYTLPFLNGGMVDPIRLYVRDDRDGNKGEGGANAGNDQRFVLDFSLSNLGRLQLDGLVRREEKLFDLIVRTDEPLAEDIRRGIMAIFTDASELAGTKGSVAFQSGGRWVEPLPDAGAMRIEA